jgi:hypothetical protein
MGHRAHNGHRLFPIRGIWQQAGQRQAVEMQAGNVNIARTSRAIRVRGQAGEIEGETDVPTCKLQQYPG